MVIFDTNILISAALVRGSKADICVRRVLTRDVPLVFSEATFAELEEVLMRRKFDRYVSLQGRRELLEVWRTSAFFVTDPVDGEAVTDCRDASDNKFLELALRTEANVVVTGDLDLLMLNPWRGVRIMTLSEFAEAAEGSAF